MYELLRKDDQRQFCYYQPGIGTYDAKVPLQEQPASLPSKVSLAMEAVFAKYVLGEAIVQLIMVLPSQLYSEAHPWRLQILDGALSFGRSHLHVRI